MIRTATTLRHRQVLRCLAATCLLSVTSAMAVGAQPTSPAYDLQSHADTYLPHAEGALTAGWAPGDHQDAFEEYVRQLSESIRGLSPDATAPRTPPRRIRASQGQLLSGTTILVSTVEDEVNEDGDCSLREAVQAANTDTAVSGCPAGSGDDTVVIPEGTYRLSDELRISTGMTIQGSGTTTTILDASGGASETEHRVLLVFGDIAVHLQELTVTGGRPVFGAGGGILNVGSTLTLENVKVTANSTRSVGGGITNHSGTLTVLQSSVTWNQAGTSAPGSGGGVSTFRGTVVLDGSVVERNTSGGDEHGGVGGGIHSVLGAVTVQNGSAVRNNRTRQGRRSEGGGIFSGGGILTVIDSEVTGNVAAGNGGGIVSTPFVDPEVSRPVEGALILSRCVVAENVGRNGGGLYNDRVTATVDECHVTGNRALSTEDAASRAVGGHGGGIMNRGTMALSHTLLRGNRAGDADGWLGLGGIGGGMFHASGQLAIAHGTIEDNRAGDARGVEQASGGIGGGLFIDEDAVVEITSTRILRNHAGHGTASGAAGRGSGGIGGGIATFSGDLRLIDVSIEDNAAGDGAGNESAFGGPAGGIGAFGRGGRLTLDRVTVSGNRSGEGSSRDGPGGGVWASSPEVVVRNSTISSNRSMGDAGGLFVFSPEAVLSFVTIAANVADANGDNEGAVGGIVAGFGTTLKNSIVGDNEHSSGSGSDCRGSVRLEAFNLVEDPGTCVPGSPENTIFGSDPLLGPLADNGGPTRTHELLLGSPALDLIPAAACDAAADQRGSERPSGAACDLGSFERACTIAGLIASVDALRDGGVINRGQHVALVSKLAHAQERTERGQASVAAGALRAFVNQVEALASSGRVSPEQAGGLISCAQVLIEGLNASPARPERAASAGPPSGRSEAGEIQVPTAPILAPNYPNPFNPETTIRFGLPAAADVHLEIYDALGRRVTTLLSGERRAAGWHHVQFNARDLPSGVYLCRIEAGSYSATQQLLLLK